MKRIKMYLPAIAVLTFVLIVWQVYTSVSTIKSTILPPPSLVLSSLIEFREVIFGHAVQTILETLIGFVLAILLGSTIAFAIYFSSSLKNAIYPLLVISQTIPIIALAPLLLIWFGFGILPKIIIVTAYCFFPIAVSFSEGLISAPKHLTEYMNSLGASRLQILRQVNIPFALDNFFAGLRISAVYAVTGAVIGEYVGAFKGLGIYLQSSASSHATALVFATIFVIVLLSILLLLLVISAQKYFMPWKNNNAKV